MMWVVPFLVPVQLLLKTIAVFVTFLTVTLGSGALIISKAGSLSLERPEVPELPYAPAAPAGPAVADEPDLPGVSDEPDAPEWPGPDED
jgi:hypothetical protein